METTVSDQRSESLSRKHSTTENPIGLNGMEFIEYASPDPQALEGLFKKLGFQKIGQHKRKDVRLYRQGRTNFIINNEPGTFGYKFAQSHGPSICATGFRVADANAAFEEAVARGGRPIDTANDQKSHSFKAIYGIGDSAIYFLDRYDDPAFYDADFEYVQDDRSPMGHGLDVIDHLTNNVPQGEMKKWCDFYENIFNFKERRHFDIKGAATGLVSKVMRSPCGKITIPINEPTDQKSQIQEYLDEYNGSGIQHVALLTSDICSTVARLRSEDIQFLDTPETYYETVNERVPNVEEDLSTLKSLKILVDGDEEGYLLQIFTQNLIGPIFYEIIQRKNHSGFGEGNFQALFDAIERDQKRRGYL